MGIIKEETKDNKIKHHYSSTNLRSAEYDVSKKELIIEFTKGGKYVYENVPVKEMVALKSATSQGKYFSTNISKSYKYKKIS
tara:strand:- start:2419 stop:2664 length:246 start_codon:yes stop_codon:yes gene_type:complete